MDKKQEEFLKKLLEDFKIEAIEHLQLIIKGLLELEKSPEKEKEHQIIENVFREIHSLKGAARVVNLKEIERLCHSIESVFSILKKKELILSAGLFKVLFSSMDILESMLINLSESPLIEKKFDTSNIINILEKIAKNGIIEENVHIPVVDNPIEKSITGETVRISTTKLSSLLLLVEELITSKLISSQQIIELQELITYLEVWKKECNNLKKIEQELQTTGNSIKLNDFFESQDIFFKSYERGLKNLFKKMGKDSWMLGRTVDELVKDMKKTLMFPISTSFEILPKLIKDLSGDYGKEISLKTHGSEIEIDRRILEEIKDPLVHIIRNCVDYGIEPPEVRIKKNKPSCGIITINVSRKDTRYIEITISDDGAGVDLYKVKIAAVKSGFITIEDIDKLSEKDLLNLIFISGVSTSSIITDLSGRGLGLAIVLEKIDKLGGTVSVETKPDAGTTYTIVLPLLIATFRGISVRLGDDYFLIPIQNVERVMRIQMDNIKTVENRETIEIDGNIIPLIYLGDVLGFKRNNNKESLTEIKPVLILICSQKRIAFFVDEILGEQQGLIKPLGPQLQKVQNINGAIVSGNGKIIPILDIADVIETSVKLKPNNITLPSILESEIDNVRHSILVAEDSITTRTLLKNILESAGYNVKTAVDGMDALAFLRSEEFDLLVTDIDMPRMNGFDLTLQVRNEKKFADLPVILITALESREDRERGLDVGANAYIIKSGFDQTNLLEVIQRLI